MGSTFRYLAIEGELQLIEAWFAHLLAPPERVEATHVVYLYFRSQGPLSRRTLPDGGTTIDVRSSPLVALYRPCLKRGVLWTAGEVHFLPTPSQKFPGLNSVSRQFSRWLSKFELVFKQSPTWRGTWNRNLQGSLRNYDQPIYALPLAMEALRNGQRFVADDDNDYVLDRILTNSP